MTYFNCEPSNELSDFFANEDLVFKAILVYGKSGCGKSHCIYQQLNAHNIRYQSIVFSDENIFPFSTIIQNDDFSIEDQFLMESSRLLQAGYTLVFENLEQGKKDYLVLIQRLLKYHKIANKLATIVLEYNVDKDIYVDMNAFVTNSLLISPPTQEEILSYLEDHFKYNKLNGILFDNIIKIADGNLQNFFTTLNILKQQGIVSFQNGKYYLKKREVQLPGTLVNLYGQLFDELHQYVQKPLQIAAPFAPHIYNQIFKIIIQNYSNFESYLDELSSYQSFIESEQYNEGSLFQANYSFITPDASNAICLRLTSGELTDLTRKYYDYLDKVYHNQSEYNLLSKEDRLLLLVNLTKNRSGELTINQIPLIIDLMTHYYNHFLYFSAIEYGNKLIESHVLNIEQLNNTYHSFFITYFKALLAVGNYNKIIFYKDLFADEDINFLIAIAHYNQGNPNMALQTLDKNCTFHQINPGFRENLLASIYDWFGDNKKSLKHFKNALHMCKNDDSLKYQLFKKYSLYVDFRLPECQSRMKEAIDFYSKNNQKQFAEALHNYGTECIKQFSFEEAKKNLEQSYNILSNICSTETYYPLNSLAILMCYESQNYNKALSLWNDALKLSNCIDFCVLAIQNNCFNAYIHLDNEDGAEYQRVMLEGIFYKICPKSNIIEKIKEIRPDIQHQLRQFYYNCGVLYKKQGKYEKSLQAFLNAKSCSNYKSVMEYAISKNIYDLRKILGKGTIWQKTLPSPTKTEKYIYEHDMYLCEIMFWG